ncbi:MAG: glycosyltransferase family 4 protein [Butyrivibrio sp.]|nr:glycosyltransferase family 4 protein [Acetatifactor muris]MCM1561550.1 glycosyltransferase family 4 protein [Butyrivibrio sp.]
MKKVLFITTISGFLQQFEMNDVNILQEMGYEVHYATNFNNPIYEVDINVLKQKDIVLHQVDIQKSPRRLIQNTRAYCQIRRLIRQERFSIIHCHNPMGGVLGRLAAAFSGVKAYVIYTAHGFHFYEGAPAKNWLLYYTAERLLAHWTDMIITINKEDYSRACGFRLRKNGSVKRIHGVGVDAERFQVRPQIRKQKREELGIPENFFHIVTAAELNLNKNQKIIIEALAGLKNKEICYSICGKGENADNLQRLIQEYRLEDRVHLLGYRRDMEEILQTADCFAFPSIREGLGIAAVEALCCGVPLIAADNRGTREYAIDNYNSIICRADCVKDFREAIRRMYDDAAYRSTLSSHCRETAENFGRAAVGKAMRDIYGSVEQLLCE